MPSIDYLRAEFVRLVMQRADGDDSAELDERIGYALSALRVAELRAERAEIEAVPLESRTLAQMIRLARIEIDLLSPDIRLHPDAYGQSVPHPQQGRVIDLPPRRAFLWPTLHVGMTRPDGTTPLHIDWDGGHDHWAMSPDHVRALADRATSDTEPERADR